MRDPIPTIHLLILQRLIVNLLRQRRVVHPGVGLDVGVLVEHGAIGEELVLHHRRVVAQLLSVELQHDVVRVLAQSRFDVLLFDGGDEIGALHFDPDILDAIDGAVGVDSFDVDEEAGGRDDG